MATRTRRENPAYAFANASFSHGYGHVTIHVYELFGYGRATLKISCQTGGSSSEGSYAWEHGLSNDYSVIELDTLKRGCTLMRRVERLLAKDREELGEPQTFAEYALRVLQATGIRQVHLNTKVNAGFYGAIKDLPSFSPNHPQLQTELQAMEQKLLSMR